MPKLWQKCSKANFSNCVCSQPSNLLANAFQLIGITVLHLASKARTLVLLYSQRQNHMTPHRTVRSRAHHTMSLRHHDSSPKSRHLRAYTSRPQETHASVVFAYSPCPKVTLLQDLSNFLLPAKSDICILQGEAEAALHRERSTHPQEPLPSGFTSILSKESPDIASVRTSPNEIATCSFSASSMSRLSGISFTGLAAVTSKSNKRFPLDFRHLTRKSRKALIIHSR